MSMVDATVELFYGGAWHDITGYVYNRAPIQIRRGLSAEGSRADPGSLALTVNNRDGRFSPRNPRSPLYGLIGRNTPIRVSAGLAGGSQAVRFVGEVVAWPTRWDTAGADVWVPLTAAGILRRLGTPSRPLRPAIYRWALAQDPAPVAYWPLDERWDAASARSATGGSAIARSTGAAPLWGEGDLGEWMPAAMRLEQEGDTGSAVVGRFSTGSTTWAVEAMLRPEEGSPLLQVSGTAGGSRVTWQAFVNPLFSRLELTLIVEEDGSGSGGLLGVFPVAGLDYGRPHLVRWEISPDGSHTAWRVLVDGVEAASGSTSSTAWSVPPHPGDEVRIGVPAVADRQVADVGHVLVWAGVIPAASEAAEAALGYVGEAAGRRVERLCAEEGVALSTVGDLDSTMPMGPQRPATLLELLDECAAAEAAGVVAPILVESRDELGLTFRTREQLYLTSGEIRDGLLLDYAAGHVSPPLEPTPDDQRLANDVVASRPSGSEARVSDETGPLGAETIGRYQVSRSLPVQHDLLLPNIASWGLHHGTWDEDRYPTIRVDVRALNAHGGDVASALALDSGGTICIDNPPVWLPPDRIEQLVLGYSESIQIGSWSQDWVTSPAGPYRVGVWGGDETHLLLASDGDRSGCPSQASHDVTDLDLRIDYAPEPSDDHMLLAVHYGAEGTRAWVLSHLSDGRAQLWWSSTGDFADGNLAESPAISVSDRYRRAVRVTLETDVAGSHRITWYIAPTLDGPWELLGSETRAGTTAIAASTEPLMIGASGAGGELFVGWSTLRGRVYGLELRDGVGGTVVASPDYTAAAGGATQVVDGQGNVWALAGSTVEIVDPTPGPADPVRYDTAGCETAASFTAGTDTNLLVVTTSGPVWTTDPADLPFDINVAGVRLRVTAIGAESGGQQAMTVQQTPINGVVKTIPAGSAVSLWTPARRAL